VVQLADETGDFYHTLIISKIENGEIFICANTNDALDKPLSQYVYATARFIHIDGVRYDTRFKVDCFNSLYSPPITNEPIPDVSDVPQGVTPEIQEPPTEENNGEENDVTDIP
jgi:hypothetical protein